MSLTVYGVNADLVEFEGVVEATHGPEDRHCIGEGSGAAEFNLYVGVAEADNGGRFDLHAKTGERLFLYPIYTQEGCWAFAVGQHDEGAPIPEIQTGDGSRFTENEYSVEVEIPGDRLWLRR